VSVLLPNKRGKPCSNGVSGPSQSSLSCPGMCFEINSLDLSRARRLWSRREGTKTFRKLDGYSIHASQRVRGGISDRNQVTRHVRPDFSPIKRKQRRCDEPRPSPPPTVAESRECGVDHLEMVVADDEAQQPILRAELCSEVQFSSGCTLIFISHF
jgi:hypothetical protein